MAVIAIIVAITAIVFAILSLAKQNIKGFIGSIFLFIAAGCMAISLGIFTVKLKEMDFRFYGWSYFIGWVGVAVSIAAGIMGFFAEKC